MVSPLCLGMIALPETVLAAAQHGVNFFFVSADLHWPRYEAMRVAVRELVRAGVRPRESIVVAVATYVPHPDMVAAALAEAVEALGPEIGHIDVAVAGAATAADFAPRLEVLRRLRARGAFGIGAIAMSFHDDVATARGLATADLDLALVRCNARRPGAQSLLAGGTGTQRRFVFKAAASVSAAQRAAALAEGREVGELYRDAYQFALSTPGVHGVLAAPETPGELAEIASLAGRPLLDQRACQQMIDRSS